MGEGERKQRIHGKQKRRTWRKPHLGVDSDTGQITAVILTDNTDGDSSQVEPLLEETMSEESEQESSKQESSKQESSKQESSETSLDKVGADGAYDTFDVYKRCLQAHRLLRSSSTPTERVRSFRRRKTPRSLGAGTRAVHRFLATRQSDTSVGMYIRGHVHPWAWAQQVMGATSDGRNK